MEKIWLQHYPKDVPQTVDVDQFRSLVDLFNHSCETFADKPAVENFGTVLTYSELNQLTKKFAAYLQHDLKLQKGDRVAIMMPNLLQYYIVMLGILRAGLVVVNVNPLYTKRELEHQLNDSGTTTIVVLHNFASTLEQALPNTKIKNIILTELGDCFSPIKRRLANFVVKYVKRMVPKFHLPTAVHYHDVMQRAEKLTYTPVNIVPSDIAYLQYTGGTTGVAKGAMLTHRNMLANLEQCNAWIKHKIEIGSEVVVTPLPLYHIFSLTICCWSFMKIGGKAVLITNPRDIPAFVKELRKLHFTAFVGLNTLFNALLNHPDFAKIDFSNMHSTIAGGMALQKVIAEKWHEVTGNWITEGYGLTEASPVVTINLTTVNEFQSGIGMPIPSTDVSIRDANGKEVPLGQEGELFVRGPQVMYGYWKREKETAETFVDGWLRTGDIVQMSEQGRLYLIDRKKDMIVVSGFNVYPNEVEDTLAAHPKILEVAVVGVNDEHSGETVKAYIVRKGKDLTKAEVIRFARENLTRYKVPKLIEFRDELPKSNVGKILRRELRDEKKVN